MFDAGMPAPFAHSFIERIAARLSAKGRDIALAEAPHRVRGKLRFAHRHKIEPAQCRDRSLRLGVERADRLQGVAEEIEPYRLRHGGSEEIEDAAPHRIVAPVAHGGGPRETIAFEP